MVNGMSPRERIDYLTEQTSLSERQAEVYVYNVFLGESEQLVAERFDVATGTVRSHTARAKTKIIMARNLLSAIGYDITKDSGLEGLE